MKVELRTFPSSDRVFGRFARDAWGDPAEAGSTAAFQRRLRHRYPAAIVVRQAELARHGEGPEVWYVFRSGAPQAAGGVGAVTEGLGDAVAMAGETGAWALLDDERRFLEVSDDFAEIVELPAAAIVGRRVEEFGNPNDPTIRADILRLWQAFRATGALVGSMRFNHADGRPRELGYRLVADEDRAGRYRLAIWELPLQA